MTPFPQWHGSIWLVNFFKTKIGVFDCLHHVTRQALSWALCLPSVFDLFHCLSDALLFHAIVFAVVIHDVLLKHFFCVWLMFLSAFFARLLSHVIQRSSLRSAVFVCSTSQTYIQTQVNNFPRAVEPRRTVGRSSYQCRGWACGSGEHVELPTRPCSAATQTFVRFGFGQ